MFLLKTSNTIIYRTDVQKQNLQGQVTIIVMLYAMFFIIFMGLTPTQEKGSQTRLHIKEHASPFYIQVMHIMVYIFKIYTQNLVFDWMTGY